MSKLSFQKLSFTVMSLAMLSTFGFTSLASAAAAPSSSSKDNSAKTAAQVKAIQTKGAAAINQRLASLSKLNVKITDSKKLTAQDATTLNTEVSTANTGLVNLNTKLKAETTVAGAKADYNQIFSGFRVYLLVVPKVKIIAYADKQLSVENDLISAAGNLQSIIVANGSNSTYEAQLTDLTNNEAAAAAISYPMEMDVMNLTPADYNADHAVMTGDLTKLQTAQKNINTAIADANNLDKELNLTAGK